MATFTKVAEVQGSAKDPYVISRNDSTGELTCTCPGWRFSGAKRGCKHTKARAVTVQPVAPAPIFGAITRPSSSPGFMLAEDWDGERDLTGWWVSEKLDGVRARWDAKRRVFISRKGNEYHAPAFFTAQMPIVDLDGELWLGRGLFNQCSGICRRAMAVDVPEAANDWSRVRYVVFDGPGFQGAFEERIEACRKILAGNKYAVVHEFMQLPSMEALDVMLKTVEAAGGEGLMARRPGDGLWTTRTTALLKIKTFKDAEAVVVGHEPGKGKHEGRLGALRCRWDSIVGNVVWHDVEFKVGTGLTDKERDDPPPIGATITFKYFELGDQGVPRFPSYVGVRDHE